MIAYIILALSICSMLVMFWYVMRYRKRMLDLYDNVLQKMDAAIKGSVQEVSYDESMDSAVTERLNRIIQMSAMQKGKAEAERDTIKSLISDISHQIRTPLSNIMLYVGLIKESKLDEPTLALADKIQHNSEKLDFFMKELIKSSYTEQEIISVSPQKVQVDELLNKACQLVELPALKKNIILCREEAAGICCADKKWTVEAIGNVLENAIKYSCENTKIFIDVITYESFVCIRVKDMGIGIDESEQGKVFQRFYRAKNVGDSSGFGIGLYLAREVLSKQGGYIKLNSKINEGTTVSIFLSRCPV